MGLNTNDRLNKEVRRNESRAAYARFASNPIPNTWAARQPAYKGTSVEAKHYYHEKEVKDESSTAKASSPENIPEEIDSDGSTANS